MSVTKNHTCTCPICGKNHRRPLSDKEKEYRQKTWDFFMKSLCRDRTKKIKELKKEKRA